MTPQPQRLLAVLVLAVIAAWASTSSASPPPPPLPGPIAPTVRLPTTIPVPEWAVGVGLGARPPAIRLSMKPAHKVRSKDRAQGSDKDPVETGEKPKGKKHGRKRADPAATASTPSPKEDQAAPKTKRQKGRKNVETRRTSKQAQASTPVSTGKKVVRAKRSAPAARR